MNSQSSSERKELDRQDSLENIFSVLHNLMGQKQTSPEKSVSPGVGAANRHHQSQLNPTPRAAPALKLDSSPSLAASLLQPPASLSSLLDIQLGVPSTQPMVQLQPSTAESASRSSTSASIQSLIRDSSNINKSTLAESLSSPMPSSFQNQPDKTNSSLQNISSKTCSNQNSGFLKSSLQKTSHLQPEYQGSIFDPLPFEGESMAAVQPHSQTNINKRKGNNLFQPFSDSNSNNSIVEKNTSLAQSSKTLTITKPQLESCNSEADKNRIQGEEVLDTLAILEDLEKSNVLSEMCKATELQSSTLPLVDGSSEPINSLDSPLDEHEDFDLRTPEKPSEEEEDDVPTHQPVKKAEISTSSLQNDELERLKNELFMSSEPQSKIDSTEKESMLSSTPVGVVTSLASDKTLESLNKSIESTAVEPLEPAKSSSEDVTSNLSNSESHNNYSNLQQSKIQSPNPSVPSFPIETEKRQVEVSKLSDIQSSLEEPLAKLSQTLANPSADNFLPSQIFETEQSAALSVLSEPTVLSESIPENQIIGLPRTETLDKISVKDNHDKKNEPMSNINNQSLEDLTEKAVPALAEASSDSLEKEVSASSVSSFASKDVISSLDAISNASQPSIDFAPSVTNISNEGIVEDVPAITSNATEHSTDVSTANLSHDSDALPTSAASIDDEVKGELISKDTNQASKLVHFTQSTDADANIVPNVEPNTSNIPGASSSINQPTVDINPASMMEMSNDQNQVLKDFDNFETFAAIQNLLADEDLSSDFVAETMGDTDVMNKTVDIPVSGELLNDEELSNLPDIYLQSEVENRNETPQVNPSGSVHGDNSNQTLTESIDTKTDDPELIPNSNEIVSNVTENISTPGAIDEKITERLDADLTNAIMETPLTSHKQSTSLDSNQITNKYDTIKDKVEDKDFEEKRIAFSQTESLIDSGLESAEIEFDVDISRNASLVSEKSQASETLCLELSQQPDASISPLDHTTADGSQNKEEKDNHSDKESNKMPNMTATMKSWESLSTIENSNPVSTLLDDTLTSEDRGTKRKSIDDIENKSQLKKMRLEGRLLDDKSTLASSYSEIPEHVHSDIMDFVQSSLDNLSSLEEFHPISESKPTDTLVSSAENKQISQEESTLKLSDIAGVNKAKAEFEKEQNFIRVDSDVIFNLNRKEEDVIPTTLDDTVIQNTRYDEPIDVRASPENVNKASEEVEKSNHDTEVDDILSNSLPEAESRSDLAEKCRKT